MMHAARLAGLLVLAASGLVQAGGQNRPPLPEWQTDAQHCTWHWREGDGLGLWAETCRLSTGQWAVGWNAQRNAFVQLHENRVERVVVQSWPLPPERGVAALTRVLTDAGHLAADADCRWQSVPIRPAPRTTTFFVLAPAAPDALGPTAQGEIPDPLCGPYGVSTHGVMYFISDLRWPARAIFVDEGQERPMFDPASIIALP